MPRYCIVALSRPGVPPSSCVCFRSPWNSFPFLQFSGKVVEPANAETSMFGSDANALFDVIEKNKKKAAEAAAAAAALSAGDGDEGEEEGEGAEAGEGASDAEESGEAA